MKFLNKFLLLIFILLQGCNKFTESTFEQNFNPGFNNLPPVISSISNQITNQNSITGSISFTISDPDTTLDCVQSVSVFSSNQNILTTSGVALSGSAPNCSLTLTPVNNAYGSIVVTVTVSDGENIRSSSFNLTVNQVGNQAPVASNITPASFNEDTQSVITLSYTDANSDLATSCSLSSLTNITVTQACACSSGTCTVGVTGTSNYNGAASFAYTVIANG